MSGMQTAPYQDFSRERLGFEFGDIQLLITALTHRSYVNEHRKSTSEHNERLEFLGDAVLELVVTDHLFRHYQETEGILTSWRAALVRTESIGAAGEVVGYGHLIRTSRGEKQGSERARLQIMANAFEALIGAIYLERGYDEAAHFIHTYIISKLDDILTEGSWRDPKSSLQEIMQKVDGMTPRYVVLAEEGPDHDKIFTLGVYSGDRMIAKGSGSSKQAAQQEAARRALKTYQHTPHPTD